VLRAVRRWRTLFDVQELTKTTVERKTSELADLFPWDTLRGTVVDVGGGSGHISMTLARSFPHLNFLVQDEMHMLDEGRQLLAQEDPQVANRIELVEHNFLQPQPPIERLTTRGPVALFFLRHIFHNWNDADCLTIARGLVPALESSAPGTPILISDRVLPSLEDGVPLYEQRVMRQQDMLMMVGLGAKERTYAEWEALFRAADKRFEVKKVHGDAMSSLVEVVLNHNEPM
jgi:hypothetical protein